MSVVDFFHASVPPAGFAPGLFGLALFPLFFKDVGSGDQSFRRFALALLGYVQIGECRIVVA